MFYDRYPRDWEPVFDNMGNIVNDIDLPIPDETVFLKSSLQGEFVDSDKGSFKQISVRLPPTLFATVEAIAQSGTLSRNSVIISLLSSGKALLNDNLSPNTRSKLNSIIREILEEDKKSENNVEESE